MPDKLLTEVRDIAQETRIKTIPMENKCKKQNDSEEALQIAVKEKKQKQRRNRKTFPFECRVPKNIKER